MEKSLIQLNDLPDEILMIILKKLHNCDVLYSFIDVNKRLDTIVNDSIFTTSLTLMTAISNDLFYPFTDTIVDRFCLEILPKIHNKIKQLNVESSSMERILCSTNYPSLHGLGLYDLASERDLFTDSSFLIRRFKSQISSLLVDIKRSEEPRHSFEATNIFIYTQIITMFNNLKYLNFRSSCDDQQLTFGASPPIVFSSILLELRVAVRTYKDCLYLLNGHFNRLHTFYVTIYNSHSFPAFPIVNNEGELINLKCFSLTHKPPLLTYNQFLVPLLLRMSKLQRLSLYFVSYYGPIIDGDNLRKNINHMTRLNKFTFSIRSVLYLENLLNVPSNEDIQNTFTNFNNDRIVSCVDYFSIVDQFHCHIYSYPYTLTHYFNISNNFRGGLFKCVRKISLFDERPFEHEFFLQIAQSFPFMEELSLHNMEPQTNDNHQWPIIEYSHLTKLHLVRTHDNYVEQCLLNSKMCLLDVYLDVAYDSLERVTDNFRRDATRVNCSKIRSLCLHSKPELWSPYLRDYFPRALIFYRMNMNIVRYI